MAMEILRPQDCLKNRFRSHTADFYLRRRTFSAGAGNTVRSGRKSVPKPDRKRQNAAIAEPRRSKSEENLRHNNNNGRSLVSGQVTILRRGESLDSKMNTLKRRSETIPPFLYAGSAFAVSPAPSDLPLPSFSKKATLIAAPVDDSATRDLRRLLRLE